jgi:3-oxoacyl-[acyl-carrier-protein] synthase-3
MDGAKVLMFTMDKVPQCMEAVLQKSEKTLDDIDYFIFHQASRLVVDNIVRRMELPEEKVFRNYENIGNTVSAALPVALKDAVAAKKISDGDLVMLVGFGVGYSWGACLVEWGGGP